MSLLITTLLFISVATARRVSKFNWDSDEFKNVVKTTIEKVEAEKIAIQNGYKSNNHEGILSHHEATAPSIIKPKAFIISLFSSEG